MRQPTRRAQWSDCETDEERAEFIVSGRHTGMSRRMLVAKIAKAFEDAAKWRKHVSDFALKYNAETRQFSLTAVSGRLHPQKPAPPWGPDAVPLMSCPGSFSRDECYQLCAHAETYHEIRETCPRWKRVASCPACVQIGWRERSKP